MMLTKLIVAICFVICCLPFYLLGLVLGMVKNSFIKGVETSEDFLKEMTMWVLRK